MQSQDLLHLDTDKLFEEHSVAEIQVIGRKLKNEIERKKEELRVMVGERYRDLMEAADTIGIMKQSSESVIGHLQQMEELCNKLKDDVKRDKLSISTSQNIKYHSVAVQIKLLMDVPEKIWSSVENENYLQATELYLFSQHVYTGLNLDRNGGSRTLQWFPVISRQWTALSHFKENIISGCLRNLNAIDLTDEVAATCLASLLLLRGTALKDIFQEFLVSRQTAIEQVLRTDNRDGGAKMQVCLVTAIIMQTVYLLHSIFMEGYSDPEITSGLLIKKIKLVTSRDSPPVINLLDVKKSTVWNKYLPAIVRDYRPSLTNPLSPIAPSELRSKINEWLVNIETSVKDDVAHLLSYIKSARGLAGIRDKVYKSLQLRREHAIWDELCQRVLIRKFNIWDEMFRSLVTSRARTIVDGYLDAALTNVKSTLLKAVRDVHRERVPLPEHDLHWFVWSESDSDLPHHAGWMSYLKRSMNEAGGLMMKTKGYSPRVQNLCTTFDNKLKSLLDDLAAYTDTEELPTRERNEPFARFSDNDELQLYLQQQVLDKCQNLMVFIHREAFEQSDPGSSRPNEVLLLARYCLAVLELCPHLQKSLEFGKVSSKSAGQSQWQSMKATFLNESMALFGLWKTAVVSKGASIFKTYIKDVSSISLLSSIPEWDTVTINEENEEGQIIESTVRIPSSVSANLSVALFAVAEELNRVSPHTVPKLIQKELSKEIIQSCLEHYNGLIGEKLVQTQALQLHFDLQFLSQLFIMRDHKALQQLCQKICSTLESFIDPFDMDVFAPHIQLNLKKCIQRSQLLLAVLVPPEKLAMLTASRLPTQNSQEVHNILPVLSSTLYFPLLPVNISMSNTQREAPQIMPHPKVVETPKLQVPSPKPKAKTPKQKRDTSPTPVRSTAGFFGAVSSSWFGT